MGVPAQARSLRYRESHRLLLVVPRKCNRQLSVLRGALHLE